jgi:hypothetical protein
MGLPRIENVPIITDLIILGLEGMDVSLGMDWMNRHKVVLDISERMVEINSPIVGAMTLYLPFKDGVNPRSYVAITSQLQEIPVVRVFADIFLDELPGMPPDRDHRTSTGHISYLQKTLPHATQGISRIEDPTSRVAR